MASRTDLPNQISTNPDYLLGFDHGQPVAVPFSDPNGENASFPSSVSGGGVADTGRTIGWDFGRDGMAGASVVGGSCTIAADTFDGEPCLKIVGTVVGQAQVDIDMATTPIATYGGFGMDVVADRATTASIAFLASADAGFAAYFQGGLNPTAANPANPWTYRSVQPYMISAYPGGSPADPGFSPGYQGTWAATPPTYPTELTRVRVRFVNTAGQVPVAYLRRVYSINPRKSRVVMSLDDGYSSAYRLLKPVFDKNNIKATWGIITDLVGATSLYMRRADLDRLYAEGHELVAHGPLGGTGNVVDKYGNAAAAVADAQTHRATLKSWGVLGPQAEKIYIWPQGKHQSATDDASYRDAFRSSGFTVGRCAAPLTCSFTADTWPDKLLLPIVGHMQAASAGAEAANIAAIVSAINNAAARGTDVIVMLHAGVPSTDTAWGSNSALNIRTTDLESICAAIRANVIAGTQTNCLLGDLIE